MARSYNLNTQSAKKAEQIGGRIDTTGQYTGTFVRAEAVQSSKGTDGIEFSFKADNGASADYLQLWTYNASGEELRGAQMLQAIMTCLRTKALAAKQATVEKYDRDAGQKIPQQADVYPDLMNKPIGLLLQMEEYEAKDGSRKWRPIIWGCYDAATNMTATEILDKATKAERLAELLPRLADRPLKGAPAARREPAMAAGENVAFEDDSIPF